MIANKAVFRIRVIFPVPDQPFFLSLDPDRPKIRIRSGKIRIQIREKNVLKLELKWKKILYFISSTLNIVLFGQAPPKPYQNHHLDPISLFMDGSGFGLLKPVSIRIRRIRNTVKK